MKTKQRKEAPISSSDPKVKRSQQPPAFQLQASKAKSEPVQKKDNPEAEQKEKKSPKDNSEHLYGYTAAELKTLITGMAEAHGWDEAMVEKVSLQWLEHGIRTNRYWGTPEYLKTFENDVLSVFPKTGATALKNVAEGKGEEISDFRKGIVEQMDKILGPKKKIVEGSNAFDTIIDPISLGKERARNPGYTTCIDWQPKLLKYFVAKNKVQKTDYGDQFILKKEANYPLFFGKKGAKKARDMGIFQDGSPDMAKSIRPKPGDIMLLQFSKGGADSHTCIIKSIEVLSDGKERWVTTDGGQGSKAKQAIEEVTRIYNPENNQIAAEKEWKPGMSQDLKGRWVEGWVNADGLVEQPTAEKEKPEVVK